MAALPPARRIVTGHDATGKAIIESDMTLHPIDLRASVGEGTKHDKGGFILIFRTEDFPARSQGPWADYHGSRVPLVDQRGTTVRIVDMQPGASSPMHRTASLDIGTVLSGEVVLEMDDGVETVMKAGDTIVQRSTIHAWHNRSEKMSRVSFVLVPAQPVVINGEILEPTKFPPK